MGLIPFARKLRRDQTDAEKKIWYFLRDRRLGGHKFKRQYPIGHYIVDFCCFEKYIIVELDGGQHALQVNKDIQRTKYLKNKGYRVLRFWDNEALKETEAVLEVILSKLDSPHPTLSHGERE